MKRSEIVFSVLQLPIDLVALLLGFIVAYHLRDNVLIVSPDTFTGFATKLQYNPLGQVLPYDHYLHYIEIIIPAMLAIFALAGLYTIRSTTSWLKRILHIIVGVSVGIFFILLLFLLKKNFFLPRATVLYSWALCTAFVICGRMIIAAIQQFLSTKGIGTIRVAVIGDNTSAHKVVSLLQSRSKGMYSLVGQYNELSPHKVIKELEQTSADELIVVSHTYTNDDLVDLRNYCLDQHISFSFVPSLLTALESTFDVQTIAGVPVIEVRPTPLEGWGRVIKRTFDIIVSLLFIVLLSPVYLLIAIILKFFSPGPLIYKHLRVGKNKRPIYIWKFRSMKVEYCRGMGYDGDAYFEKLLADNPDMAAEWHATYKFKNDPRISKPGAFLRKSSLDELPQFFNVLRGELSLVGPRPIVAEEVEMYGEQSRILFSVKPGLTGPWQVSGRNDTSYDERLRLYSHYIEHWNVWLDIVIMFKTGLIVILDILNAVLRRTGRGGAY